MVTAEFALTLPAVVMMLVAVLFAGSASAAHIAVTQAAGSAARALAAGADVGRAQEIGQVLAGSTAIVTVNGGAGVAHALVVRPLPAPLGWVGLKAQAQAAIPLEGQEGP